MKIQDLLTDPSKWCQRVRAEGVNGDCYHPRAAGAVRWCLLGAVERVYEYVDSDLVLGKLRSELPSISIWNDDPKRTFAEVRALIEKLDI